jgi:acetyl-CoA carboxylase biotin carboxyl carrier protein
MNAEELAKLLAVLRENGVTEFELQKEGVHLRLNRESGLVPAPYTMAAPVAHAVVATSAKENIKDENCEEVRSPIVGTFYRRPSPDAEAFAEVGTTVKKGDTLCIIEAMKLMNEIEAPCSGVVEKVLLNDGQVVEFNEVLFIIRRS